ncbi:hypothetical protein [Paraburkholderia caribensis]|uniref:hypothetical protein n=1 Tax=Paraburkholderia caribensis TaxID=75105 RepID=UPI001CAD9DB3|nr:hypothetical protein [Paraburkholderia caribensis]CAG9262101.1 conserved hypothetical protein [Paraburkholderia caribensis]
MFDDYKHPKNWYEYLIVGSIELMEVYIDGVESQIERGIEDYRSKKQVEVCEPQDEYDSGRIIEYHMGLADATWDIREIFEEYFPNLQRRSGLITLFSFFEHELDKLCNQFRETEKYALSFKDLQGTGNERSMIYLEKIVQIDIRRNTPEWQEIKSIQSIRNLIVHADGRLSAEKRKESEYVNACHLLRATEEVIIEKGYLEHVLATFKKHFEAVNIAIGLKYKSQSS